MILATCIYSGNRRGIEGVLRGTSGICTYVSQHLGNLARMMITFPIRKTLFSPPLHFCKVLGTCAILFVFISCMSTRVGRLTPVFCSPSSRFFSSLPLNLSPK